MASAPASNAPVPVTDEAKPADTAALSSIPPAMSKGKLFGRAFYESIGSPTKIVAPMVDQSEFIWRLLSRSFEPKGSSEPPLLAYTPMLHARHFHDQPNYRAQAFQAMTMPLSGPMTEDARPYLDGHKAFDRPLFVQFCANDKDDLFKAAQLVAPYCDAVDLNLGCPQHIARRGRYGAFLQEEWDTISSLIRTCHEHLSVPITAKMRILDTRERTLEYARMILASGANILTVHGRTRQQKGHNQSVADWEMIRYLRDNLPPETVMFANGNIRCYEDIGKCLQATGCDGVMSAVGNLRDPAVFYPPPEEEFSGRSGYYRSPERSGWRLDFMFRRYLDLVYIFVLHEEPPARETEAFNPPLPAWITDAVPSRDLPLYTTKAKDLKRNVNIHPIRAHLFSLLEDMIRLPPNFVIRDKIVATRTGEVGDQEPILAMLESSIEEAIAAHQPGGHVWWVCGEDFDRTA